MLGPVVRGSTSSEAACRSLQPQEAVPTPRPNHTGSRRRRRRTPRRESRPRHLQAAPGPQPWKESHNWTRPRGSETRLPAPGGGAISPRDQERRAWLVAGTTVTGASGAGAPGRGVLWVQRGWGAGGRSRGRARGRGQVGPRAAVCPSLRGRAPARLRSAPGHGLQMGARGARDGRRPRSSSATPPSRPRTPRSSPASPRRWPSSGRRSPGGGPRWGGGSGAGGAGLSGVWRRVSRLASRCPQERAPQPTPSASSECAGPSSQPPAESALCRGFTAPRAGRFGRQTQPHLGLL